MSYTKQTWANGDVITAEKLNHIEDGIAGAGGGSAPLVIRVVYPDDPADPTTLDKTFNEIFAAYPNCYMLTPNDGYDSFDPISIKFSEGGYGVFNLSSNNGFSAESPDGVLIMR